MGLLSLWEWGIHLVLFLTLFFFIMNDQKSVWARFRHMELQKQPKYLRTVCIKRESTHTHMFIIYIRINTESLLFSFYWVLHFLEDICKPFWSLVLFLSFIAPKDHSRGKDERLLCSHIFLTHALSRWWLGRPKYFARAMETVWQVPTMEGSDFHCILLVIFSQICSQSSAQ